ncbi:MAG: acyltransferase family protein [Pseudomonas sp.]|nr:acyltransferase family protein [Pseudomonas sp.]
MPSTAGYVGVDIFFVISGYLITALLLREHEQFDQIDLYAFYSRRVRRIFPAVVLVIMAVIGFGILLLDFRQFIALTDSAIASLLFTANLYFEANTGGYFQESAESLPLLHLWSLSVEEQFYLIWPVLLISLLRLKVRLVPTLTVLAALSFGLAEWQLRTRPEAAFYQMPARFWELAIGGLIAAVPTRQLPRWVIPVGLLLVLDSLLIPAEHFPGLGALPVVIGTALVLYAIHGGASSRLLSSPPLVGVGLISYSLYLWHWPLLAYYQITAGREGSLSVRLLLCSLAVLLAFGSYRYVEQPLRRRGSSRFAILLGCSVFTTIALGAYLLGLREAKTPESIASRDKPTNASTCHNLQIPKISCASGAGPVKVAIWGDSMALAWQPLAWNLANKRGMAAMGFSMDGCKPAIGYSQKGRPYCKGWNANVLGQAEEMDTIILVGRWGWEFFDLDRDEAERGLRSTLEALHGVRQIIVIGPTPVLRADAFTCMEGNDLARCAVSQVEFLRNSSADRRSLQALVQAFPNAEYVEASAWLCRGGICPATRDGMILYYDNFHVSSTAARAFALNLEPAPSN